MWRTTFIALGLAAIILGFEFLVIDSASFYSSRESTMVDFFDPSGTPAAATKEWRPAEWMPWAVLSVGAIVVVYAFTLPSRFGNVQ
jgi:hypothetical protein